MTKTHPIERYTSVPLFAGLAPAEISELLRSGNDVAATAGDVILKEGAAGDGLYVISAGAFEVVKSGKRREVLARLETFSAFGDMSLVSDAACSASVVCVLDGRLKRFPKDTFNRMLDEDNLVAHKVMRNICKILAGRLARIGARLTD